MSIDRWRHRAFPRTRRTAKLALVRWDSFQHRNDPSVAKWIRTLDGARAGHLVVPSRAVHSSRGEAADFAAHGLVKPGDRVLDVGAANGRQAIGLLEMGISEYVGLEIVKDNVERSNDAFKGFGNVRFDLIDVMNPMYNVTGTMPPEATTFPYPDGYFDFVVAGSLYTHLERLDVARRYVQESARVLRAGGGAFMSFFRSPPNVITSDAMRTVFAQEEIERIVKEFFRIRVTFGGETAGWHDQWRFFLSKPE